MTTEQRGATEDRIVDLEVWTDVACPWCYIGATRLAKALEAFDRSDRVRVRWRAFELNPNAETGAGRREVDALVESKGLTEGQVRHKFGQVSGVAAEDGLHLDFETTIAANTFDAHRLVHLAGADTERGGRVVRALYRAHFEDGRRIDDIDELAAIGAAEGLDAGEVRATLAVTDTGSAEAVRDDEQAATGLGVSGVPFFVADRKYAVSGAQPVEVLTTLLQTAFDGPQDD